MTVTCDSHLAFWVAFPCLLITLAAVFLKRYVVNKEVEDLERRLALVSHAPSDNGAPNPLIAALEKETIDRGQASLKIVGLFSAYHYIAIIGATLSGAFGGVATVLIASLGWPQANQALQGFFLGCAGSLSFWLTVIQVFKYPDTIAKHEAIYIACANLLGDLRLAKHFQCACKPNPACDSSACVKTIAARLQGVRAIGISFDASKLGMPKLDRPGN